MRLLFTFLWLVILSAAVPAASAMQVAAGGEGNLNTDYLPVLQKAGVKKVRCIFKDNCKFIWIGTENGLYRYDGTNVDILQHDAGNPHSLPSNTAVNITEDKAGNIWAGTLEGAVLINPASFVCRVFNKRLHNLGQDFDIKVYADHEGKIWAGGRDGLDLFDEQSGKFKKVWQYPAKGKSGAGYVNCMADWKKDSLVFGTFDGAVIISTKNFGYRRLLQGSKIDITRVFSDEDHKLWLGTWGFGCYVSDNAGTKFTRLKLDAERPGEVADVVTGIISTAYNHNKVLWVATLRGVYKVTGFSGSRLSQKNLIKTTAWTGSTNNIMADDEQYIWEAGNVVSRFFTGSNFFQPVPIVYKGSVQDIKPVNIKGVNAIATLTWYAASGVVITNTSGKTLYRQPEQKDQDHANVGGLAQDKYERLWISSLAGVDVLGVGFKPVFNSDRLKLAKDRLSASKTNDILINHDTVWVACYKKGIDLYDLNFHKLHAFAPGDKSGLTDDYVSRIFSDSKGRVWLCGNTKLFEYQSVDGRLRAFNFNRDSTSFPVNSMAELPGGDLLIASASGLFRFNPKKNIHTQITSPLVENNNILAVSVDGNGDIWFINAEHLVYYQVKTRHFTLFGHEDGLSAPGDLAWLRIIGYNHFYLATDKQIVSFVPGCQAYSSRPASLYFHDIAVNDSTLARGSITNTLKLKYNENRLNIGFGVINYIKPEQNLYAYRLTGVDDEWIYSSHNFASYANLAPGAYTFKLKAANYAGTWSDPITMSIVVSPPFWGTWWFRLLSFVFVGALLFIAVRYVLQRNLRERILRLEKEQAVEKERNRIARDMHDDLGSGLTKIAILSEVTKAQMKSPAHASTNLDVISNASRELVDNLQDIIWVLNPRNDSLSSLILYIKEYAESFFEPTGLQYEFVCDQVNGETTLSEEQRRNIFLAVKESCNNILKHACCSKVCISLKMNQSKLLITISDDGRGFDLKQVGAFSNGLQNIRNRMDQIGANYHIIPVENEGTTSVLTIPI